MTDATLIKKVRRRKMDAPEEVVREFRVGYDQASRVLAEIAPAPLVWHGCYDDRWTDEITKASFAHPAKMAKGLLKRIIEHGFERGYWQKGDVIGDCFGGIGTGGIMCAYMGLAWVGSSRTPDSGKSDKASRTSARFSGANAARVAVSLQSL